VVEVLVAMTVTGIGAIAVLGALRSANDAADRVRDEEAARLLAERHLVAMLAAPPEKLGPARGVEGKFVWEEQVRATKVSGMARVQVIVSWRSRGRPRVFELLSMRETQGSGRGR